MNLSIEDTRKQALPTVKELIGAGTITLDQAKDWLRTIYEIRFFEEKVYDLLGQNVIKGASHLYAGQEAVATGAIAAMERGDVIGSTHRGHGHCGAVGNKYANSEQDRQDHWNAMMAELMGKETGYCKGRGGSMHIAEVEHQNNLGSTGIVGGNQPPAVGAALAEKFKNTGKVVLSFFGDGSCNTGTFHESMNMAATLKVPLVAIIENNLYGMSVPFSGSEVAGTRCASSIKDIAVRSVAYDVPGMIVDGQDTVAVFLAVRKAIERARKQNEMMMVECKTYRWYGHSRSDPRAYRTKAEEKAWHERDPITVLRNRLICDGLCTEQELDQIKDKAFAAIEDATQFAMNSPWPNGADVAKDVYVEETLSGPGHRERAEDGRQGPRGHRGLREDRRHLRRQDQERGGRDRQSPDQVPVRHGRREHRRGGFDGPGRGNAARQEGLRLRRGRRPLRRRLSGHARPARGIRQRACDRHRDLRGGHRRRGGRRGPSRHAADRRDHVRRLPDHRHGPARARRRVQPLHVRRQGQGPDGPSHRRRRGPLHRRPPLRSPSKPG